MVVEDTRGSAGSVSVACRHSASLASSAPQRLFYVGRLLKHQLTSAISGAYVNQNRVPAPVPADSRLQSVFQTSACPGSDGFEESSRCCLFPELEHGLVAAEVPAPHAEEPHEYAHTSDSGSGFLPCGSMLVPRHSMCGISHCQPSNLALQGVLDSCGLHISRLGSEAFMFHLCQRCCAHYHSTNPLKHKVCYKLMATSDQRWSW